MSLVPSSARRRAGRAARWLAAAALAGLAATAAAQAPAAAQVPATAGLVAVPLPLPPPQPIPLNTANWSPDAKFGSRAPAWYTDGSGVVHLQGGVQLTSQSGAPYLIGTLPAAARPVHYVEFLVHTFLGTFARVSISETGLINIYNDAAPAVNDWSFVSLEDISFLPSGAGSPIAVNTQNWSDFGGGIQPLGWYKDSAGIVHLQGEISQFSTSGPNPDLIGTLPAAAAPAHTVYTVVDTGGGYADLAVEPNGTLDLIDPRPPAVLDYSFVYLGALTYKPAGQGNAIPLNNTNWSGNAKFDSRGPAWYSEGGIIHLQGAVTQASTGGSSPDLIGTLPPAARPGHTVYTIVHTYLGTYADLAIEPGGQLALIDPRPPMVKDYTFVSLESITYRR